MHRVPARPLIKGPQLGHTLKPELLYKIEDRRLTLEDLREMEPGEIGAMLRITAGDKVGSVCPPVQPRGKPCLTE